MMVVRVIVYIIVVVSSIMLEHYYAALTRIGLSKGPYIAIFLFCIYAAMLYFEVRANKREKISYALAHQKSFQFSFSVGIIWGVMMSFAAGFHYEISPLDIVFIFVGYIAVGFLFGYLGRCMTNVLWTH